MNRAPLLRGSDSGESRNHPIWSLLGQINNPRHKLAEVSDNGCFVPVVIVPTKKKGMRLPEADFSNVDPKSLNQDIVFCRGTTRETLDCFGKRFEKRVALSNLCVVTSPRLMTGGNMVARSRNGRGARNEPRSSLMRPSALPENPSCAQHQSSPMSATKLRLAQRVVNPLPGANVDPLTMGKAAEGKGFHLPGFARHTSEADWSLGPRLELGRTAWLVRLS
jgi:hypothetical protein